MLVFVGDVNVNQNLGIALFQNLFLRFHNYIANRLQTQRPFWTDEIVYQESRRIVAAVIQIITYDSYLPIVLGELVDTCDMKSCIFCVLNLTLIFLGEQYMNEYGLTSKTNYDPTITVSMAQEMTSGAFRILHNIIPAQFRYVDR